MLPPVSKPSFSPTTSMPGSATWRPPAVSRSDLHSSDGRNPPVTITGVAPWAFQSKNPTPSPDVSSSSRLPNPSSRPNRLPPSRGDSPGALSTSPSLEPEESPVEIALQYIEQCRINGQGGAPDDDGNGTFWAREQAALKPTLLPELKFHDLVFGQSVSFHFGSY